MSQPDTNPTPLQTATTEELIDELIARSQSVIVSFIPSIQAEKTFNRWSGNAMELIGLATIIRRDIIKTIQSPDDDE